MSFLQVFLSDLTVLDCLSLMLPLKPVGVSVFALFILVSDYLFRHVTISFSFINFVSSLFIFRDVRSRRGEVCKRQEMDIAHGGTE